MRRYYIQQKVVADVLGLTEYLDNYEMSALWEGQSGFRERRSWKKMSEYQGLVLEQHVLPSLLVDHVACKEAMFQPLDVVLAKQGTVVLIVRLLTRTLAQDVEKDEP